MNAIDELRHIVKNFESCDMSKNGLCDLSIEQLVQIHRMWMASDWDIYPDKWDPLQVRQALMGRVPRWQTLRFDVVPELDNCGKCDYPSAKPHACPFKEDVNNDSVTLCNCCLNCQHACADDV